MDFRARARERDLSPLCPLSPLSRLSPLGPLSPFIRARARRQIYIHDV